MPIFGGINETLLKLILELSQFIRFKKNDYVFKEGDPGGAMYVILSGSIVIEKVWKERAYILRVLNEGDCFGEMAFIDLAPRSASIRVIFDCEVIRIDSAVLMQVYQTDIEQFTMIHMNISREISRRLRIADQRMFELTHRDLP